VTIHTKSDAEAPDVHIDWHMTPEEWAQLSGALATHAKLPYIAELIAEGKIPVTGKGR
jgi:hypothetical protein